MRSRSNRQPIVAALALAPASIIAGLFAIGTSPSAGQDRQPPAATFRTAVDLVPVDVNIVDRTGRPVAGLAAPDFVLMVDNQPRRIASAQYIDTSWSDAPAGGTATHYSSNTASAGGRMVMLVVDQGNIGAGRARQVMEAAQRFISSLNPADRVGLTSIPAGPQIDFTANHALVGNVLPTVIGQASGFDSLSRIGLSEAAEIQRGSRLALDQAIARECSTARTAAEVEICTRQVISDAMNIYSSARDRGRTTLSALRQLVERLASTASPKTLVFVSEGLFIDREFSELAWLGPAAARGQVVAYVLQIERPLVDASRSGESATGTQDRYVDQDGLVLLANLSRGAVMRVVGGADAAFARLALEISGYYLLTFEPEPGDSDGKPHKIRIEVPGRTNVEIRARSEFVIGGSRVKTDEDLLTDTLRAPLLASDIGLKVSTYTLRDPASDRLRVLMSAEIERTHQPTGKLALAYVLIDAKGTVVASQIVKDFDGPLAADGRTQQYVGSILTNAGIHTLKLAVVDDHGKRGSVEHAFRAELTPAGRLRTTDLVIAPKRDTDAGAVMPAVAADFTTDLLHGYLELYGDSSETLNGAAVVIEVAASEGGSTLDSAPARMQVNPDSPNRRTAEAVVPIALLPPGDYVARAVVTLDGAKAGQVTRPFRISRGGPASAVPADSATGASPAARTPIVLASRIDAFERQAVLAPEVVGFFVERMNFGPSSAATAAPAVEHVRGGRIDAALDALRAAGNPPVPVAFLTGIQRFAAGDLEGAASKFRESLKLDPEFFAAAFYLGSCYAAGGRDREAVGAWQTSLITESDAPFIYTLLSDALLRLREVDQALDIIREAASLWPEDDQVQLRLGTALAMGGNPAEAIAVLDPYLSSHPADHERRFLVLRTIYEARAAGRVVRSASEDRELFARHASAYAAANGPQLALVEKWRAFIERN